MANTNYRKGYRFERAVEAHLNSVGYSTTTSRGSHTIKDVVAVKRSRKNDSRCVVLYIQCKTDGKISVADWNKLYSESESIGAIPVIAAKGDEGIEYRRIYEKREPRKKVQWHHWAPFFPGLE